MRYALLIVAMCCAGCNLLGPKEDLSGNWIAQGAGHTLLFGFTLVQSGDEITGKACASSDGLLLYKDAPVTGDYPDLQFTVAAAQTQPCCSSSAGLHFSGKQDGTKDIVGRLANGDLRFKRSPTSLCP